MTYEELKAEAKRQGYKLMKINADPKLLPCTCGWNKRDHIFKFIQDRPTYGLKCQNCGKIAVGYSEREAIKNWNKMIEKETRDD